ncbi:MAG TPA: arsenate reductase (glutaredoxin) [Woeseiaceae bacterium]|nr:arsenate reductase (glutaredoxin) [Woeseiaceae bacterium]
MNLTIYHNPACSKSRRTLEILREHGIEPRIIEYLKTAPDRDTILELARRLDAPVETLVRHNEDVFKQAAGSLARDDDALAGWLAEHPKALQRPVVVDEDRRKAVIGRPPENVLDLLPDPAA